MKLGKISSTLEARTKNKGDETISRWFGCTTWGLIENKGGYGIELIKPTSSNEGVTWSTNYDS
jgi:hypothetical protein